MITHDEFVVDDDRQKIFESQRSENHSNNIRHSSADVFESSEIFQMISTQKRIAQLKTENKRLKTAQRLRDLEIENLKLRINTDVREAQTLMIVRKSKFIKSEKMRIYKNQNENEHQR